MDKNKDGKISLSEWLTGTEAIADFCGEKAFLTALLKWSMKENSNKLQQMVMREQARKQAVPEAFEAPDARLKPPFSAKKKAKKEENPLSGTIRASRSAGGRGERPARPTGAAS